MFHKGVINLSWHQLQRKFSTQTLFRWSLSEVQNILEVFGTVIFEDRNVLLVNGNDRGDLKFADKEQKNWNEHVWHFFIVIWPYWAYELCPNTCVSLYFSHTLYRVRFSVSHHFLSLSVGKIKQNQLPEFVGREHVWFLALVQLYSGPRVTIKLLR